MQNKKNNNPLPPLLRRAKYLLLFVSGVLIIANLYFLSETRSYAKSLNSQQSQATWYLFQLTKEYAEFQSSLALAPYSNSYQQSALLKYELTWSRFDLLIANQESSNFLTLPGAKSVFFPLFERFKALEPNLELIAIPEHNIDIAQQFEALYLEIIDYVNTNFRVSSSLYQHQMDQARELFNMQLLTLLLLIFGVLFAAYILHKESEYHREQSLTDSLTQIPNRLALFNDLRNKISRHQPFRLFILDLDGFKQVNDQYGHQAGDHVLKAFAEKINSLGANCYRIGGDEFAILSDTFNKDEIALITNEFHQRMHATVIVTDGNAIQVRTSVGSACFPDDSNDLNELINIADNKMYVRKHTSKKDDSERSTIKSDGSVEHTF
ncbi:GGDEF domain-containing protein [Vibrio galatheae]|uniref:GGDEF domain-containing protein n=1 Tax=Vibrio galatheae TaxID=579748 RepID=UPI0005FA8C3C|nr:GGDEF domain-containing protein [Vibrio galatheae]